VIKEAERVYDKRDLEIDHRPYVKRGLEIDQGLGFRVWELGKTTDHVSKETWI
jgi:hypothetical protein